MVTTVLIVEDEPEFLRRFSDAVMADDQLRLLGAVNRGGCQGFAWRPSTRRDAGRPGPARYERG